MTFCDGVFLRGNNIDVIPAQNDELDDLLEKVRRGRPEGWPIMPLSVGCIEPVGILNGWMK